MTIYLGYSFFQVLISNPPLKNHPNFDPGVKALRRTLCRPDFETSNHKEMKLYSTLFSCLNKVAITVVGLCLFITAAKASGTPVYPSVYKNLTSSNLTTVSSGVVYASIDATANEKSVTVKWVTASEQNNGHFEVERSLDMKAFKMVALILDGFDAEGTGKAYAFKEDAGAVRTGKTVYYRLKQIDTDGKVSYSTILAVRLQSKQANTMMELSPNPLSDNLSVRINSLQNGVAEIRVVSLAGQTLLSKQSTINKGYTNIQVEGLDKLTTGMYLAQLVVNGTVIENQKLIKN
jgi:Secretion system C-terminal sorting domain